MRYLLRCFLMQSVARSTSDFWAVLVAGSRGFANYRHQADLCHTYLFLTETLRIDPSHVVMMMYDDVAWSLDNPLLGRLYNEPDGSNVYEGCKVDYRSSDVSISTLEFVLNGKQSTHDDYADRKTIKTDNKSTVFISFVDHGEPEGLLFPNGDSLTGKAFRTLIENMGNNFNRIIMYVEACYAGSVFQNIDLPEKVIVITASNATESSWGTFCPTAKHPSADVVNGIHVGSCLADLFEISWKRDIEDRMIENNLNVSFGQHVHAVKLFVAKKSHVMVYGDLRILEQPLLNVFPLPLLDWASPSENNKHNSDRSLILESALVSKCATRSMMPEKHHLSHPVVAV